MRALRRDPNAADTFPQDVLELQGYFAGESRIPGVDAIPGRGTNVPLYILGSSLFGARLAAALGLPYAFASHFAPQALQEAVAVYRREFQPSPTHPKPYVIAGINVIAADDDDEAERQRRSARRRMVTVILGRGREFTPDEADMILETPAGAQVMQMLRYFAVGTADAVTDELRRFARHADADELILAPQSDSHAARLRSLELIAEGAGLSSRLRAAASAEGA